MANLNLGFDPSELPEPDNSFDPLPVGEYLCTIEKVECKQSNKNPDDWYLDFRYSVIGADYTKRKIFDKIHFKNHSETCERIAAQSLGQLIRATKTVWVGESDDLIGKDCYVKVSVVNDPQYGAKNEVKGFRAVEGAPTLPTAGSAPVQNTAPGARKPPFFGAKK